MYVGVEVSCATARGTPAVPMTIPAHAPTTIASRIESLFIAVLHRTRGTAPVLCSCCMRSGANDAGHSLPRKSNGEFAIRRPHIDTQVGREEDMGICSIQRKFDGIRTLQPPHGYCGPAWSAHPERNRRLSIRHIRHSQRVKRHGFRNVLPNHVLIYGYAVGDLGGRAGRHQIDSPALMDAAQHRGSHVEAGLIGIGICQRI